MWKVELNRLVEETKCAICMDFFKDPVILRCGHNFCAECLLPVRVDEHFSCPQCRDVFTEGALTANRQLADIVDRVKAVSFILETGVGECHQHSEALTFFCEEDGKLICEECKDSQNHNRHAHRRAGEAAQSYKETLELCLIRQRENMENVDSVMIQQEERSSYVKDLFYWLKQKLAEEFDVLHAFLNSEEEELRKKLKQMEATHVQQMEENQALLSQMKEDIRSCIETTEVQIQKDGLDFFETLQDILKRNQDQHEPRVIDPDLNFLGEVTGPLQYKTWKRMKHIFSSGLDVVTFDPDTADPLLLVSEDWTHVRPISGSESDGVQDSAPRSPTVLGSQGFQCGRHYWEVEVGENASWRLGVIASSTYQNLSPCNDLRVLKCCDGSKYTFQAESETDLLLSRKPRIIGIYLDCELGQLSFYDAENEMEHIFSDYLELARDQQLHPYFCLGIDDTDAGSEGLRIVSL